MQALVGVVIVLLGTMHFLDRDRPIYARRRYFVGHPDSAAGRGALALLEVVIGFFLMFTA